MNNIAPPFIGEELTPNVEILGRLANAFNSSQSVGKTQLHLASRLRWDSFLKYLNWLQKNKHVASDIEGGTEKFHLTKDGREMFNQLGKLFQYMKNSRSLAVFSILDIVIISIWMTQMNF